MFDMPHLLGVLRIELRKTKSLVCFYILWCLCRHAFQIFVIIIDLVDKAVQYLVNLSQELQLKKLLRVGWCV